MTLLEAVRSLGMLELAATSWIAIRSAQTEHLAVFTVALLLPFLDTSLSEEFRAGQRRFWPDQKRFLDNGIPIQDQIVELRESYLFGNLGSTYLMAIEGEAAALWIIETHAGSREERLGWLRSVITMEGRSPIP